MYDYNALFNEILELRPEPEERESLIRDKRRCSKIMAFSKPVMTDGAKVLDIGCNYLTALMARAFPIHMTAMDVYRGWEPSLTSLNIDFALCNIVTGDMPFEDSSFDVVTFCDVIEHLPPPPYKYLEKIFRVLKPGGKLVLTAPNIVSLGRRVKVLLGRSPAGRLYPPNSNDQHGHLREYDARELKTVLRDTGYHVERVKFATVNRLTLSPLFDMATMLTPSLRRAIFILASRPQDG